MTPFTLDEVHALLVGTCTRTHPAILEYLQRDPLNMLRILTLNNTDVDRDVAEGKRTIVGVRAVLADLGLLVAVERLRRQQEKT